MTGKTKERSEALDTLIAGVLVLLAQILDITITGVLFAWIWNSTMLAFGLPEITMWTGILWALLLRIVTNR